MARILFVTVVALVPVLSGPRVSEAHDMWIEPSDDRPAIGQLVEVRLRVGHAAEASRFPRRDARIERFVAVGEAAAAPIPGLDGRDPAGYLRPSAGLVALVYASRPAPHRLSAERFEAYLAEEGLRRVQRERVRRGETDRLGLEVFSRSLKALVAVGSQAAAGEDRWRGLRLELLAEQNPYGQAVGDPLSLRLAYEGKALPGAQVEAVPLAATSEVQRGWTDAEGRVRFELTRPGRWLVTAVHMVRADRPGVDWESVWSSLTFGVPQD